MVPLIAIYREGRGGIVREPDPARPVVGKDPAPLANRGPCWPRTRTPSISAPKKRQTDQRTAPSKEPDAWGKTDATTLALRRYDSNRASRRFLEGRRQRKCEKSGRRIDLSPALIQLPAERRRYVLIRVISPSSSESRRARRAENPVSLSAALNSFSIARAAARCVWR